MAILAVIVGVATPAAAQCKLRGLSSLQPAGGTSLYGDAFTWHANWGETGTNVPCDYGGTNRHVRLETWINGVQQSSSCTDGASMSGGACIRLTPGGDTANGAVTYTHTGALLNVWCQQTRHFFYYDPETYGFPDTYSCWDFGSGSSGGDGDPPPAPECPITDPHCGSPIVMPLTNSQSFKLTSRADGVYFDINGDGSVELISWTAADSRLAFLAIDRDGDGQITSGKELFGSVTVPGVRDGFSALLRLMPQGTADLGQGGLGRIDAGDPIFERLLLWEDRNHNGLSEPNELRPLSEVYTAIGAGSMEHRRRDGHGNEFRYKGWAIYRTAPGANVAKTPKAQMERQRDIYDVIFVR